MSAGSSRGAGSAPAASRLPHYQAGAAAAPGRYSGFVGLMRYLLPALAAALLGLVVAWPFVSGGQSGLRVPLSESGEDDGRLTMVKASYQGTDAKDRPFTIRGEEVFQADKDSPVVHISGLGADIFVDQGQNRKLEMTAREGVYDRAAERLDLAGEVTVRSDRGHEFRTASARVDLPEGVARGSESVSGKGPHGLLDAGNFALMERGNVMVFGGRVRMTVFPYTGGGSDGDSDKQGGSDRG